MNTTDAAASDGWASAWPDAVAFVVGLGLAWWLHWQTSDLVWSLWLSSLCVGYTMIVWAIFRPVIGVVGEARSNGGPPLALAGIGGFFFLGALFLLAFFTVHFGGFHFVHSVFLNSFFPVQPGQKGFPGLAVYGEVFRRYWMWLPVAFLAERATFQLRQPNPRAALSGDVMMTPYKNVIRMHLLIFFFAFASFAHLDNFAIYAAVYAVYFFPWRLLRRDRSREGL
jgi:hypothetical protein